MSKASISSVPARRPAVEMVKSALLNDSLEIVEYSVIKGYCDAHNLSPVKGSFLDSYLRKAPKITSSSIDVTSWTLDDLVMACETLVPSEEAKKFGAVFTPSNITTFMAKQGLDRLLATHGKLKADLTVLDPAVGCGALLVATLRDLHGRTSQKPSTIVSNFTGIDISAESIKRAHLMLDITCLTLGDTKKAKANLIVGDGLTKSLPTFDLVIANPPYVRYQQLPVNERERLASLFASCRKGNINLYFAFVERCLSLVKEAGSIILIHPNGFMTSASGASLRGIIASSFIDTILDFGHTRVFEAMTYTAILMGTKEDIGGEKKVTETKIDPFPTDSVDSISYLDVPGLQGLDVLPLDWIRSESTRWTRRELSSKAWALVGKARVEAIRKIRSAGQPLSTQAETRFGVATCRDGLYLLDGKKNKSGNYTITYQDVTYEIEPGITRRCHKVAGLLDEQAVTDSKTRIIYPYIIEKGKATVIDEKVLKSKYPKAYLYFTAIKDELARRDNGRKTYASWYAYARTQGLVPYGPRLLTPLYAGTPRFMVDKDKDALFVNGCSVVAIGSLELDILAFILNSIVTRFYVQSTAVAITGGYYAYQKSQLAPITIPKISESMKKQLRASKSSKTRDKLLCSLYGLDYDLLAEAVKTNELIKE